MIKISRFGYRYGIQHRLNTPFHFAKFIGDTEDVRLGVRHIYDQNDSEYELYQTWKPTHNSMQYRHRWILNAMTLESNLGSK